jgi:Domain of unknown function (DUF4062)
MAQIFAGNPFRVFVGSTFEDLQLYRFAVMDALHKLEVAVVGMEYLGSQPEAPLDTCITAVGKCQAYIGIFAMRYGSIDPLSGQSITHLEYEEAQRLELPSLIYLLDEDRQAILPKYVDTGASAAHLSDLKNNLKKHHVVSYFTTPDDLAKRIVLDVPSLAQRVGAEVRQSELAEIVTAIPRIDWLSEERFAFLVRQMGPLAAEIPDRRILREVLEFLLSGDRQAAVFLLCRTSHPNIRSAIDFAIQVGSVLRATIFRGMRILDERGGSQTARSYK